MSGGGKARICDQDNFAMMAGVVNHRLLVDATISGGAVGSDVNIAQVGGVAIGPTVPVSGTVNVGNFPATQPVSGTVTVLQGTNPWTVDGTVNVGNFPATVAVTQSTSPWVVSGTVTANQGTNPWIVDINTLPLSTTVGSVTPGTAAANLGKAEDAIHGSGDVGVMALGVRQDTAAALAANGDYIPHTTDALGNLRVGGASTLGLGKVEDAPHASGDVGTMALAVRQDSLAALAGNGDYIPLSVDALGRLYGNSTLFMGGVPISAGLPLPTVLINSDIDAITTSVVPGTSALHLGKAEDAVHGSGDTGVMALGVRADTLASTAANGDYVPFLTDSVGAVWVRSRGDVVNTIPFSASTRGRPVQIAATASAGTLVHTASTTQLDKIYLSLANISAVAVSCTVEYGATGAANEIDVIVPANETIEVLSGTVLGGAAGGDTVAVFAATTNVINAVGRVERLVA